MQVFSVTYLKFLMKKENKRVETVISLTDIPHEIYNHLSFESELDYEVLGVNWANETFIIQNDWGEVEEIKITDPRFKIDTFAPNEEYPTNYLLGVGMNQKNQWIWF